MARVKDYWIYQERRKSIPWAIHVFATKDGRVVRCDFDLYAEWVPCKSNKITVKDVALYNVKNHVQNICEKCNVEFTLQDATQLDNELKFFNSQMKG